MTKVNGYVDARMKLIPTAERMAIAEAAKHPRKNQRAMKNLAFCRAMTELAENDGLIGPGNLELFDAPELPTWYANKSTRRFYE